MRLCCCEAKLPGPGTDWFYMPPNSEVMGSNRTLPRPWHILIVIASLYYEKGHENQNMSRTRQSSIRTFDLRVARQNKSQSVPVFIFNQKIEFQFLIFFFLQVLTI